MSRTAGLKALAHKVLERDTLRDKERDSAVPHRPPKTTPVGQACPAVWDLETADLIRWFMSTEPPAQPFEMQRGVTIAVPVRYWQYLRADVRAGPNRARGRTGALQADLRRLHKLFGGD